MRSQKQLHNFALVTYHPEYHSFDPCRAVKSLAACTELACGWVRSDIRWNHLMPSGSDLDVKALSWYREFLSFASDEGLKNMVVLSSPPAGVLAQTGAQRIEAWVRYVDTVATNLGNWCNAYQLMNEPNNPVYGFFRLEDTVEAIRRASQIIKAADSHKSVALNISMEIWGWETYLRKVLELSGSSVDVVGLDHYPGTWTVGLDHTWKQAVSISQQIALAQSDSPWYKRQLAILETGFSTNAPTRTETNQAEYFHNLKSVIETLRRNSGQSILVGIYELCDADSSTGLDPEAHFGLLTSDLKPKQAFASVQSLIASLG